MAKFSLPPFPEVGKCSLCGGRYNRWGNNPDPLGQIEDRCCDACNSVYVIPARIAGLRLLKTD